MNDSSQIQMNMEEFGRTVVLTPDAKAVEMRQMWKSAPAIFVFLRHFACIACRAHAAQVWADRQKYEAHGGRIIFIGNGQPHFIEKFREDLKLHGALIVTDPKLETFRQAGFRNGFFYVARPATVVNATKLMVQGHRQTAYSVDAGTHWQLGEILVVSTAGKPLYRYISETFGDFPEERTLRLIQRNEGTG